MSVDDLESLEETIDIMDKAALLADIRESLAELGDTEPHRAQQRGCPAPDLWPVSGGDARLRGPLRRAGR